MRLIRIGKAISCDADITSDDYDQLQPGLILRDEDTGQTYLLVHDFPIWELRPVGPPAEDG